MLKRVIPAILIASALVAGLWSSNADAGIKMSNGLQLANGVHLSNGLVLSNGLRLSNGLKLSNGKGLSLPSQSVNTTALQPVRLTMPDGTELNFR